MIAVSLLVALSLFGTSTPEQSGQISGHVTAEGNGAPIADARVTIILVTPSGQIRPSQQTQTGQDGLFQFDDVEPGGYRISVQKTGFAPEMRLPEQGTDQLVHVGAGQSVSGVDRRLPKGAVISGRIFNANGEPIPDVQINAMSRLAGSRPSGATRLTPAGQSSQTNDLGEFRVSGLVPGEYVIAAMPTPAHAGSLPASLDGPRMALAQTYYPGTMDEAAAALVKVGNGAQVLSVNFAMQSAAVFRVSGRVVDERGEAVSNANVMVNGDGTTFFFPGRSGRAGSDGRFVVLDVPAGRYSVQATVTGTSNSGSGVRAPAPSPIVITDADITGLRLVTRRSVPQ